jgi:ABC-type branched-subunit amino acid transport system ATPase component
MLDIIKRINCERGITVLISDQTPRVLDVAERVYVLEGGQVRIEGRSEDLKTDDRIIKVYLGMDV